MDIEWQSKMIKDDKVYYVVPSALLDKLMNAFNKAQTKDDKIPDYLKDALFDLDAYKQHGDI